MKVAYIIPGMSGAGGAERSLAAMAPFLRPEIELHVATFTGRTDLQVELEEGGAVLTDLRPSGRPDTVRKLVEFIGDVQPDLVHTTLIEADVLGRLASAFRRTPVVSSLVNVNHGPEYLKRGRSVSFKHGIWWAADASTARLTVRFHALTNHVAATMGRRLMIPPSRIEVIPRGRNPDILGRRTEQRRTRVRESLGVGSEPLIIAAARHEAQKGLDVLIRAAAKVAARDDSAVVLIGGRQGAQTDGLTAMVKSLGLDERVRFIGQRDDLADLMSAADIWCVPSRWEGLGSILIEAMALEVPVVTTDIAPIREVAGDPPVFSLVPPNDPARLADEILLLLDSPGRAADRATAGRQRFLEHFRADMVATQMVGFYHRSVQSSRLARR